MSQEASSPPRGITTWLAPPLLAAAAMAAYMFLNVPPADRPWSSNPPVPRGSHPSERAYTRYLGAMHEARLQIKDPDRRAAAEAAAAKATKPQKPAEPRVGRPQAPKKPPPEAPPIDERDEPLDAPNAPGVPGEP
jgi:hypothetical protein